ncbi:hypothetical protein BC008_41655 [Mastigocoleus testarum BC008]|uniref:Uncharacterized protein n=1 Tax=Mastigocoleus testarum BC008 TaxID=371196 RepID=A0A0V7ZM47_9CYAN|nr:hypothetical protein BC008_41655 [Mastigocoleus testarum BC008]
MHLRTTEQIIKKGRRQEAEGRSSIRWGFKPQLIVDTVRRWGFKPQWRLAQRYVSNRQEVLVFIPGFSFCPLPLHAAS